MIEVMGCLSRRAFVIVLIVLGLTAVAQAQAIVDDKGTLSASLTHNFAFADSIAEKPQNSPNVFVHAQTTTLGVEYVLIDKLAVGASLPLVGTLYNKTKSGAAFDPHGPYDDGNYHFTLQDLKADVRYMVLPNPHALAFNVGLTVPVADYPVQGSAASGRHLVQGRFGVATTISPGFLPRSFINAGYELTLSQKFNHSADTSKFGQSRSDLTAQLGYFVTEKLPVFLATVLHVQHDGVEFVNFNMLTADQKLFHDPILKESTFLLGLGASYQLTEKFYASGSYMQFIAGNNTLNSNVVTLGLGWTLR